MECRLIINGTQFQRSPFLGTSPFYGDYTCPISNASQLDVASAIGCARQAERASPHARAGSLHKAAQAFSYTEAHLEHAVRLTGMPLKVMAEVFAQIPQILRQVPESLSQRFFISSNELLAEEITPGITRLLVTEAGFCYAITPGNDPRATALVAANLGNAGIPFVLRASIRDTVAPLVIQAMVDGGFDPKFCSLLYMDHCDPEFNSKHFRLVDASSILWTFGAAEVIDQTLRYEPKAAQAVIDLSSEPANAADEALRAGLEQISPSEFARQAKIVRQQKDHFVGKKVLRHESGNCAAIIQGAYSPDVQKLLWEGLSFANVCTALKSAMLVECGDFLTPTADYLNSLVVGDPLHPDTEVGYIDARQLDSLDKLVRVNASRIRTFGGQRLSKTQAAPLLVASQDHVPAFFAQEIPAYILSVCECEDIPGAVEKINSYTGSQPRLGVSLVNLPRAAQTAAILRLRAHSVLVDQSTSKLIAYHHEGNDYAQLLTRPRLVVSA